jgi:chromosomal replication initiation ATPase DnaA
MIVCCPQCQNVFEYSSPINQRKIQPAQVYDIINLCCEHFNVTGEQIFSKSRKDEVGKARHIAMYLIYAEETNGITLEKTGEYFYRDHTTVLNARNRCKDALFTKGDVYKDLLILSYKANEILDSNPLKQAV